MLIGAAIAIAVIMALAWLVSRAKAALPSPPDLPPGATEAQRIDAIRQWAEDHHSAGRFNGGIAIISDGEALLLLPLGIADPTTREKLSTRSSLRLASVSKQFTAVGILVLVEAGELSLDDPIADHLHDLPDSGVLVRHLLTHTSGVPDQYLSLAKKHQSEIGEVLTISDVAALIGQYGDELSWEPGSKNRYSNTDSVLAAAVIESVSGSSFEDFMAEQLFAPLGMAHTGVWNLLSDQTALPGRAKDMTRKGEILEPTFVDGVAGDGAVHMSLEDLVAWDRFWSGNDLISGALLTEATSPTTLTSGETSSYGFGWMVEPNEVWHNGSWLGARTILIRRGDGLTVGVISNGSDRAIEILARSIVRTMTRDAP